MGVGGLEIVVGFGEPMLFDNITQPGLLLRLL